MQRTRALYKAKGYSGDWIEKRMRGIALREELTDEWKKRDVKQEREYAILIAEIAKAAFGITPGEHKQPLVIPDLIRNPVLTRQKNLRDHMTDLELIFSMLGEAATTEITRVDDVQGFHKRRIAARKGGEVAGSARKDIEQKTGKQIVSQENYLDEPQDRKRLKGK